jgi:hypothetical protein
VVNLLSAVHQLAWMQYPTIWLCESCAILWLAVRAVRSRWVQVGVLLVLCGLMLNALVTDANAGAMPVVGMPSTLHPVSPMWRAATPKTRLAFLGDQVWLGLFSVGDLTMLFGGVIIVAICLRRTLKTEGSLNYKLVRWIPRSMTKPHDLPCQRSD